MLRICMRTVFKYSPIARESCFSFARRSGSVVRQREPVVEAQARLDSMLTSSHRMTLHISVAGEPGHGFDDALGK